MIEVEKKYHIDSPEQYDRIYQLLLGKGFKTKYHRDIRSLYRESAQGVLRLCYCLADTSGNSREVILLNTKQGQGDVRYESEIEVPEPIAKVLEDVAFQEGSGVRVFKALKNRACLYSESFELEVCLDEVIEPCGIGPWFCEVEKIVENPGDVPLALRHIKHWSRQLGLVNEMTLSYYEMIKAQAWSQSTN